MPVTSLLRHAALGLALTMAVASPALAQIADDLSGTYQVRGQNPGSGQGTYGADITVKMVGEVYQLTWASNGQQAVGSGLRLGDTFAVTWQDPASKESAIAVYIVMPDGGLKGRWAPVGSDVAGTEDWARKP